ncbi:hypothetical protein G9A89_005368 [Geosiphon pyriformis]|nr:hypothetical protein G9A89_005368 [Geosiphon pyriformis]
MEMAASLARKKEININSNFKRQEVHSDWAVVIKEISIDMPKKMIVTVLAEFDQFRALLFILPVRTIAHDLGTLLERVGKKTCIINCSLNSGNRIHCAVVGFVSEDAMKSTYHTELTFNGVKLSWARLDLVHCEKYGFLGHLALECNALSPLITKPSKIVKRVTSEDHRLQLAKLYTKKSVPIFRPAAFGGKFWAQVVSLASPSGDFYFTFGARSDFSPSGFLELLANQVLGIVYKLNGVEFVPLVSITQVALLATSVPTLALPNTNIVLDVPWPFFPPSSLVLEDKMADLGLNSSKVLTSKVGSLESKMMALEVSIGSILEKLQVFTSGLDVGFHGAGVAIIINNSLARHVLKMDEVSDADNVQWLSFKDCSSANFLAKSNIFEEAKVNVQTADMVFSRIWYSEYNCLRNKQSSKFFKLELLVAKVVRCWNSSDLLNFDCLIKIWLAVDAVKAFKIDSMVLNSVSLMELIKHLLVVKKGYYKSKYYKSKIAKDTAIKKAIDCHMENFYSDKKKMIKSILECLFCKVVLDHLVVDNELQSVLPKIPNLWAHQYMSLNYVDNGAFSGVIVDIGMEELSLVVDNLLNNKAAGLSGIPNKLWKHCGKEVLVCLLKLLNLCLSISAVPNLWKEVWVSMILKSYEWNGILTNTKLIALVKIACKILSKILSDWISLAYSKFNVLHGDNFSVLKDTLT